MSESQNTTTPTVPGAIGVEKPAAKAQRGPILAVGIVTLLVVLGALYLTDDLPAFIYQFSENSSSPSAALTDYIPKTAIEKQAMEEFEIANRDSFMLKTAVILCYGATNLNLVEGMANRSYLGITDDLPADAKDRAFRFSLNSLDMAVLHLDQNLVTDRWRTYRNALKANADTWRLQLFLIMSGAFATLFVTIKSTEQVRNSLFIGVMAMSFSTLSTGLTGWNAFAAPAAQAATLQQRLATLEGIHLRLMQLVERSYSAPLCPRSKPSPLPIPGEATSTPANDPAARAYARAVEETMKLREEYAGTLQSRSTPAGGDTGQKTPTSKPAGA